MELAIKISEELYDKFYNEIPTRVMVFHMHKELAVKLALVSARKTISVLEKIADGMMSRTCRIGTDPSEVLALWKSVEAQLLIKTKSIKEERE
jgi:hypothetical protein